MGIMKTLLDMGHSNFLFLRESAAVCEVASGCDALVSGGLWCVYDEGRDGVCLEPAKQNVRCSLRHAECDTDRTDGTGRWQSTVEIALKIFFG